MNERSRNFVVGLTALAGLVLLGWMLLLFGYVPGWLDDGYFVTVDFPSSGGLESGSRVRMQGVDVGQVRGIWLKEPVTDGVRAQLRIKDEFAIPEGTVATVSRESLIGSGSSVNLDVSHASDPMKVLPRDGSAVVQGVAGGGMADQFAQQLQSTLERPLQKFEKVADQFVVLSEQWEAVGANLRDLTAARTPAQVDAGQAHANLSTILQRTDQRMAELKQVVEGLNRWVGDEQLRSDVQQTAANARQMTERAKEVVDQAGQDVDKLVHRYVAVADDLSGAIGSMRMTLDQMRQGQGTLGKLINDSSLYDNLNDTAQRMDQTLTELRLLLQKWKAEGLPIQF